MDTIAAISTGNQITAIGVLRVSGPEALAAADRVFRPLDGRKLSDHPRRQMVLGVLLDGEGQVIDRCLAVTFAAGHSYTGRTAPSSTATAPRWCWPRGSGPSSPPGSGRRAGGSSPRGPSSTAGWT